MKNLFKYTLLLLLGTLMLNCGGDDDGDSSANDIVGEWRITSGSFYNGADKFAYFYSDNTVDVLRETTDDFKGIFNTRFIIDDSAISIDGLSLGGSALYDYTLEGDILAFTNDFSSVTLQRVTTGAPEIASWITELTVLEEGNAPWESGIDMAFSYDKTQILYGNGRESDYITLINPITFAEVGQITTTHEAYAVEVEKLNFPDRYVFQSNNGFARLYGYYEDTNDLAVSSVNLGSWIRGLASVNQFKIWAASANENTLYLYDYTTENIDESIPIQVQPNGLDYQNGILYVCAENFLHKCQITPNFAVLETYSVPDIRINGVAFDGTNFWINGYSYSEDAYKIIKTSLTL